MREGRYVAAKAATEITEHSVCEDEGLKVEETTPEAAAIAATGSPRGPWPRDEPALLPPARARRSERPERPGAS